jgi:hypothetical protein
MISNIDMAGFVHEAGVTSDPSPGGPDAGDQKLVAGFYQLLDQAAIDREAIEAYLIDKGYGNPGDKLSEENWESLVQIHQIGRNELSGGIKY